DGSSLVIVLTAIEAPRPEQLVLISLPFFATNDIPVVRIADQRRESAAAVNRKVIRIGIVAADLVSRADVFKYQVYSSGKGRRGQQQNHEHAEYRNSHVPHLVPLNHYPCRFDCIQLAI